MKVIKELCLAGACNRGICYIGSIKKLEEENLLSLEKIIGTSIGAFIATCYIIGYKSDEMLDIIINKNTGEFKDISFINYEGAIMKGDNYRNWIYEIISKKIDPYITLEELYKKTNIYFLMTATCIYSSGNKFNEGLNYFSHEHSPNIPLIIAVNASMCFPFVFPPIKYEVGDEIYHFIDGGVLDNFPLDKISSDGLALRVEHQQVDGLSSIKSPISYVGKLFELISKRLKILNPGTTNNLIVIKCDDFSIIDFEMSIDDKITLYKRGYNAASKFINDSKINEESIT